MSVTLIVPFLLIMNDTFSAYIDTFDEINTLISASYRSVTDENAPSKANRVKDDVLSLLIQAYREGVAATSKMLAYDLFVDINSMYEAIYVLIDGKTFEDRVFEHVIMGNLASLQRLTESEYHRVFNVAEEDAAREFQSSRGLGVSKKWITVRDNDVRDTHRYLEGTSVSLDEEFYTFDGDHASHPGGFTKAENNVNCRCVLQFEIDTLQD